MALNILIIGDVVGKLGRRTVASVLPGLREAKSIDLVIANGENAAGGRGMTPQTLDELRQRRRRRLHFRQPHLGKDARSIPFWRTSRRP